VGGIFKIHASQFGLPIRWTGQWESVESPGLLLDIALDSPFAIWRHSHIFYPSPGGCEMTDRVEFLQKGGWAGGLVSRWAMPVFFSGMFRARHAATLRFFRRKG
jgi:ligand-binding SRPBCC domain-containing protein